MDLFLGQRVALGPRTGAIIDIRSPGSVTVHFDSGGVEDVDPNTLHYASDDYPELQDIIWERPSPEKALEGDPYLRQRSRYRPRKTASAATSLSPSVTGDSGQMHTDNQALPGPILSIDFIPYEPGVMCSYCNERPAECTVNGASLCLEDAQERWGIPMDEVAGTPGIPGEAPQMPQEGLEDQDEGSDGLEALQRQGAADWGLGSLPPLPPPSKPPHLQTPEEFANDPKTFWHGSPNGEIGKKVAHYGIHIGTHRAAKQALEASVGRRADGKDWDGTQEYGKTLLSNDYTTHHFHPETRTWTEHTDHHEPTYPTEGVKAYSDGSRMELTDKPALIPLRITGEMTNTSGTPHEDYKANGYMQAQLKKGVAKRGYYYTNIGEDEGSISAVIPSRDHVKTHEDFIREAGMGHEAMAQYQGDHEFVFTKANPREMGGSQYHRLVAWPKGQAQPPGEISGASGYIAWHHQTGKLNYINTRSEEQRQGLATELWRRASEMAKTTRGIVPPRHSNDRTNPGEAWARSLNQRLPKRVDPSASSPFGHEAAWRDVMEKAKRLRETNAVHLLETPTPQSPYVFAEVKGDNALHHCFVAVKGGEQGQWSCSCDWGDYGPNGPLAEERAPKSPYKRRPCSHILATRWELQSRTMFGRNPYTGALHMAMNAEDEVPEPLGKTPIPEGTVRLFHNTWGRSVPNIREHGLLQSYAEGDSQKGFGNEPSAGIWAATKHPAGDSGSEGPSVDSDRHTVEFWAHPHQISQNAEHYWGEDPQEWAERSSHHVIMNSDIPPHQIAAIHAPWHTAYRQIKDNPRGVEMAKNGELDWGIKDPEYGHSFGPALEKIKKEGAMGTDILDDWFSGRFMVEARAPSQYEPIHSGWNPSGAVNHRATHFEDLPEEHQKQIANHVAGLVNINGEPLTHEKMVNNILNMHSEAEKQPGVVKNGKRWYQDAHNQTKEWAKKYGMSHRAVTGIAAAVSPGKHWDSNLAMAHYYTKELSQDPETGEHRKLRLNINDLSTVRPKVTKTQPNPKSDREMADEHGLYDGMSFHPDHSTALQAHWGLKLQAKYTDQLKVGSGGRHVEKPDAKPSWQSGAEGSKAVRIARGEDPDQVLGGHKVRSFFNNMLKPGKTDDVTVDSHAASLAAGAKMAASSETLRKMLDTSGHDPKKRSNTGAVHNTKGAYSYIASAYREAHRRLQESGKMDAKSTPSQLQSITWKAWRNLNEGGAYGGAKPKEGFTEAGYPVLGALNDDQDEGDDDQGEDSQDYDDLGELLDPFAGPDEDDPDLYRNVEPGDDEDDADGTAPSDEADVTKEAGLSHMYDWSNMLRQSRRQALAAKALAPPALALPLAPYRPPEVPLQYLPQTLVQHHLSSGMDEFGFEHQADAPSAQWQAQHSPGADNPADTAPPGFGDALDPAYQNRGPYVDERLLEPGPVISDPLRAPSAWGDVMASVQAQGGGGGSTSYEVPPVIPVQVPQPVPLEGPEAASILAEHQAGLEYLRPPSGGSSGLTGASAGMSREALLAQHQADKAELAAGAEAFLRSGSIPVPGFEVNMDSILAMPPGTLTGMGHEAKSRDFTPAEQDEMVREGELEGVKASNLHMLRLQGSMYEELERQLASDDQSEASANALWW